MTLEHRFCDGKAAQPERVSSLGDKKDALELQLTLNAEVLDGQVLLPVIGQRFVEGSVLILGDFLRVPHPNGLLLVDQSPLMADLLDLHKPDPVKTPARQRPPGQLRKP